MKDQTAACSLCGQVLNVRVKPDYVAFAICPYCGAMNLIKGKTSGKKLDKWESKTC